MKHNEAKPLPSAEELNEFFAYDPDTGQLTRKNGRNPKPKKVTSKARYSKVMYNGIGYLRHRLIWRMVTGTDPGELFIDHKDGNATAPDANRWSNLRLADRAANGCNSRTPVNSTIGLKGVSQMPHGKYRAQICKDQKRILLGTYSTATEAHQAYRKAATELFGEFARFE